MSKDYIESEIIAHKTEAYYAEVIANNIFEEMARDNKWYNLLITRCCDRLGMHRRDPNLHKMAKKAFIAECAPTMLADARQCMAKMLNDPKVPEDEKMNIYDAFLMSASIPAYQERGGTVII